jgi:hypothetical protein
LDPTVCTATKIPGEFIRLFAADDSRCTETKPIIGFAISFPGYGTPEHPADAIEYLANSVWVENDSLEDIDHVDDQNPED